MSGLDTAVSPGDARDTADLEAALQYRFRDPRLLDAALCHPSYAYEHDAVRSNQRLEFLGDAVVGVVVAQLLFEAHPDWEEGDLTKGQSSLVDRPALAQLARDLGIGSHLQLGKTEIQSDGHEKDAVLADATEAVLAAMYLDGGLEPVIALARRVFAKALSPDAPRVARHPKTDLQERVMSRFGEFPSYEVLNDSGVDNDPLRFSVCVNVVGKRWGEGVGRSKNGAERAAAEQALSERSADLVAERSGGSAAQGAETSSEG